MKVHEFMKKINAGRLNIPVFLQEGIGGEPRKAWGPDFFDGYYDEKYKTLQSITITDKGVTVYYK